MPDNSEGQARKPMLPPEKAEGAFLALAAGDALGWPQEMRRNVRGNLGNTTAHIEFEQWARRSGGRFQPYEEAIQAGDYSDDTQLTLAVARSRTNYGAAWWQAFTRVELPLWTLYERGGGGATKRAANAWIDGRPPWKSNKKDRIRRYFEAGGNGAAMRVLPHALFFAGEETPAALMHDVVLDGSATHGHPRALIGATAYAYAAWVLTRRSGTLRFGELLDTLLDEAPEWSRFPKSDRDAASWFEAADNAAGERYEPIWKRTAGEMRALLEKARKGLRAGALADDRAVLESLGCFGRAKGAGTSSAAAAAYLFARYAAQPEQGILRAAFEQGADTDTLASMTGGLMGCLAGSEWLPQPWLQVQDAQYLRDIARRTALGPQGAEHRPVHPLPHPRSILATLENGSQAMDLGGAARVVAIDARNPKPLGKSIAVHAWRLQTSEGQTLYVARTCRLPPKGTNDAPPQAHLSKTNGGGAAAAPAEDSRNALYGEFCRQLQCLLESSGSMQLTEIEGALGIVRSQARKWLKQAEQDGKIFRASKKPVRYGLPGKLLL